MAAGIGIQNETPLETLTTPENQQKTGKQGTTAENGAVTE